MTPSEKPTHSSPVAWLDGEGDLYHERPPANWCPPHTPLYAHPTRRPLTDEQIDEIADKVSVEELSSHADTWHIRFASAIERAHGIKGMSNKCHT